MLISFIRDILLIFFKDKEGLREGLWAPLGYPSSLLSPSSCFSSTGCIKKQTSNLLPAFAMEFMKRYSKSNNFGYGVQAAVVVNDILLTNVLHEDQLLPRALGKINRIIQKDSYPVIGTWSQLDRTEINQQ